MGARECISREDKDMDNIFRDLEDILIEELSKMEPVNLDEDTTNNMEVAEGAEAFIKIVAHNTIGSVLKDELWQNIVKWRISKCDMLSFTVKDTDEAIIPEILKAIDHIDTEKTGRFSYVKGWITEKTLDYLLTDFQVEYGVKWSSMFFLESGEKDIAHLEMHHNGYEYYVFGVREDDKVFLNSIIDHDNIIMEIEAD